MLSNTPSGFVATPFTKSFLLCVGIGSVMMINIPHALNILKPQLWRFVACNLFFANMRSAEALIGTALLYNFRILERHWGSWKFSSFCCLAVGMTAILNIGAQLLFRLILSGGTRRILSITPGPIGLALTLAVAYNAEIPTSSKVEVAGIEVSDHVFLNLVVLQLALLSGWSSVVPAVNGLIVGLLITHIKGLSDFKIPEIARSLAARLLPLVERAPTPHHPAPLPNGGSAAPAIPAAQPAVRPPTPNEHDVEVLCGMGFPRERAVQALAFANNDLQNAVQFLVQ